MFSSARDFDHLEQVHELNRLFLNFLKKQAENRIDCLDMAASAVAALRSAPSKIIDVLAEFPRALFRLRLHPSPSLKVMDPGPAMADLTRLTLHLTILHSAWHFSRRSSYEARLFFGLTRVDVSRLKATPLSELPRLAFAHDLIGCAFPDSDWLWHELLTETRPEHRRQLLLVGLQPVLALHWPVERTRRKRSTA